jgi:replicative DNA helicase
LSTNATPIPTSIDAERALLGAVILDESSLCEIEEQICPEDLYLDSHQRILRRMIELSKDKRAIDIVTLSELLSRHKEIEAVGGVAFLASLTEGLPRRPVITEYIAIVKNKALLRRLMMIGTATVERAADQSESALEVGQAIASQLEQTIAAGAVRRLVRAGDFLSDKFPTAESMVEHAARTQGVKTGFDEFDALTCGLQKEEMVIVAARPSIGKTAWLGNVLEHISVNQNKPTAFFSVEMSKQAVLTRMVCSRGHVPLQTFRKGRVSPEEMAYFRNAKQEIEDAPLYIDDTPRITLSQVRSQALWLKNKVDFVLLAVDHLGKMSTDDAPRRYSREQEVAWLSAGLAALSKELKIPVVVLCQLSRELTKRDDKRPKLSDLRESGSIEQDADLVAFLHRPEYYDPEDATLKGKGEIIVAKQRQGPTGTLEVRYEGSITRWSDVNKYQEQTSFMQEWMRS